MFYIMKTLKKILGVSILALLLGFVSCKSDTQAPNIYLLGADGNTITEEQNDTIVLLYSIFTDPGVLVEDNVTATTDIIVESDIEDVLSINDDGFLRRTGELEITYTATDEESNVATAIRNITISNVSTPFIGSYETERTATHVGETLYISTLSADSRVAGRISFPKVYAQEIDGEKSYYNVAADLFSEDLTTIFNSSFGYLGLASDNDTPFFNNLNYSQAIDSILSFTLLRIDAQEVTDNLGNVATIAGRELENLPLSRIEYVGESKTIYRIVLELNVTIDGLSDSNVVEIYTPN